MPTKITPVLPPKAKEDVEAAATRIFSAIKDLGLEVDPDGFVRAWMSDSTRVVLAYEGDKATGLATMAFGRRYYDHRFSASIIFAAGPAHTELLMYLKDMAVVLGAEILIYEPDSEDPLGGTQANVRYLELP